MNGGDLTGILSTPEIMPAFAEMAPDDLVTGGRDAAFIAGLGAWRLRHVRFREAFLQASEQLEVCAYLKRQWSEEGRDSDCIEDAIVPRLSPMT